MVTFDDIGDIPSGKLKFMMSSKLIETKSHIKAPIEGSDFDKLLDDYEDYMDKYSKIVEKAKNGDKTALTDQQRLTGELQQIVEGIQNANGAMTAKQLVRMTAIQAKMLK